MSAGRSFELPDVDWATVGTVGEPGHRTFYLQARKGGDLVTLKMEKQQVAAMAQFLTEILSDLPTVADVAGDEGLALVEPLQEEWAVGSIQLGYDGGADRILIIAEELGDDEGEEDPELSDHAAGRFSLTRTQASRIAKRGFDLVVSGRPRCGLCGNPMDPEGHSCPRTNGKRPST